MSAASEKVTGSAPGSNGSRSRSGYVTRTRNSPAAVQASKRLIALANSGDLGAGLAAEVASFGAAFVGPDQREGMQAFIEKRPPTFIDPP